LKVFKDLLRILKDKDLLRILQRSLKDIQRSCDVKIFQGSLIGSFRILEDSVKILERSLKYLLKDLTKIFARILQDL